MRGAVFSTNTAFFGGAVSANSGRGDISEALFFRNEATEGGGLFGRSGTISVDSTTFNRNAASGDGGAAATQFGIADFGGVLFVGNEAGRTGGAVAAAFGRATLDGGNLVLNRSRTGGGGVAVSDAGRVRLTDLSLNRNVVTDAARGFAPARGGGAVLAYDSSSVEADDVRMFGNRVEADGDDSGAVGGAIAARDSNVILVSSDLTANVAAGDGGGVFVAGRDLTLRDTEIRLNDAGGDGGGIYATFTGDADSGRGADTGEVRIDGGALLDNVAGGDGGGLAVLGIVPTVSQDRARDDGIVEVRLSGAAVRGNTARFGGGVHVGRFGELLADGGSTLDDNAARRGGAAFVAGDGTLRVRDASARGNRADAGGAAFVAEDGLAVLLADAVFRGNGDDPFAGPGTLRDLR